MDKYILAIVLLSAIVSTIACSDNKASSGNVPNETNSIIFVSDSIDNSAGAYNGQWRFISEFDSVITTIMLDQAPAGNISDTDSYTITHPDTSLVLIIENDSFSRYEKSGETYTLERRPFPELNEDLDTTMVKEKIGAGITWMYGADSASITLKELYYENFAEITGDTLHIGMIRLFDIDFTLYGMPYTGSWFRKEVEIKQFHYYADEFPQGIPKND